MREWLSLVNGISVTLFGSILSASFCISLSSSRNRCVFGLSIVVSLLMQGWFSSFLGMEILRKIYPLTIHLPLVVIFYFLTRKLMWSLICVLTAYLCCQLRRWLALLVVALVSGGAVTQNMIELVITVPLLLLLLRFVSRAMRQLINYPYTIQCQFGAIPVLYYVFDYATVVYTDLLMNSGPVIVEFMPFVCCTAYLIFLLYNFASEQKRNQMYQLQKSLDVQLEQSVREINTLRESQALLRQYRHDLRHDLQYVSACIENGQGEQAQNYIADICKEIEAQTVKRYCENETANLLFSAFAGRAKKDGIIMNVQGVMPASIMVLDRDLCVLLSNALENALHACQKLSSKETNCIIDVQFYMKNTKLFLQITNPCEKEVRFEKGIPVSDRPNHGIGVQSICTIVEKYGGVYTFSVREDLFILRLSI